MVLQVHREGCWLATCNIMCCAVCLYQDVLPGCVVSVLWHVLDYNLGTILPVGCKPIVLLIDVLGLQSQVLDDVSHQLVVFQSGLPFPPSCFFFLPPLHKPSFCHSETWPLHESMPCLSLVAISMCIDVFLLIVSLDIEVYSYKTKCHFFALQK